MLKLNNINLEQNPELIQPPQVDDNIVVLELVPDVQEIIDADILDVGLSYSIAGIDVVLEMEFESRHKFNNQHLASLICNGGWSLSLLPPEPITKHHNKSNKQLRFKHTQEPTEEYAKKYAQEYAQQIITWYQLWRSQTMINFDKAIYPITPYLEYLSVNYLIDKHKKDLKPTDTQALIELSHNPSNPYLLDLIDNMESNVVDEFKKQLKDFIDKHDRDFYQDIDLLTNQVAQAKAKC